jgi:hypothetical protein
VRKLVVGLITGALGVAMLPGVVAAKADDAAACKKDGWMELVREDGPSFKSQGQCVGYVAKGGTPAPPNPWEAWCLAVGGEYIGLFAWYGWEYEGCSLPGFFSCLGNLPRRLAPDGSAPQLAYRA